MEIGLDRPWDRLITERIQLLSGWIRNPGGEDLSASRGDREIALRSFPHPLARDSEMQGFYGFLALQEFLPWVRQGRLRLQLRARSTTRELHLRVSPLAEEAAQESPLDLNVYPMGRDQESGEKPHTLVFPGLGCVGGTSLNFLIRMKMYRHGWDFPVYSEANEKSLWERLCRRPGFSVRWIDGHHCYDAATRLPQNFARVTLLREPLRRILSVYNYNSLVHPRDFHFATVEDFLLSPRLRRYSQATGLLRCAGISCPDDTPDDELYSMAQEELTSAYTLAGITELFEESVFLLGRLAGYRDVNMWWRILSAPNRLAPSELPDPVRDAAESALAADTRLYRETRRALLKRLAGIDFGENLKEYKRAAAAQAELSDGQKMAECLRWRQTLTEEQLFQLESGRERQPVC